MDPFTLAIVGIGGGIIAALGGLGAVAAPVTAAAVAAGPIITAATAFGVPAAVMSVGGAAAPAALVATDPHASQGAQNGIAAAVNQAQSDVAGSVNGLQIPGVPEIHFN